MMDRSDVITLVNITQAQDDYGVWRETEQWRDVYCQVDSVTRAEFFEGGRSGLNPEFKFTVFYADYQGEKTLVYDGKAYSIYRTYMGRNDYLELYAERKGGTNGKGNS